MATLLGLAGMAGVRLGTPPGGVNLPLGLALLPTGELAIGNQNEAVLQLAQ